MKLKDLRGLVRLDLDDRTAPYRWADKDINGWVNEAENEAARRGRLLVDSTTEDICTLITRAGKAVYELDPRIIFVRRVKSSRFSRPLDKITTRDLDANYPGWQGRGGEVLMYCLDFQTGSLLTYKEPTASLLPTLTLTVVRLPLEEIEKDDDEPEINPRLHAHLRHWAVHRAFNLPDEETYRPQASAAALARFEAQFGRESTAVDEAWINANHGYDQEEGIA